MRPRSTPHLGLTPMLALAASLAACGASSPTGAPLAPAPPADAEGRLRVLAERATLRLQLATPALYREPDDGFSVRLRVVNIGAHDLHLDLASPTLVGPTHFGPLTSPERTLVDERRLPQQGLDQAARAELRRAREAGALTRLRAGESLDVYAPFHGRGAALFMGFATPWVFVSLDGFLDAIGPGDDVTRLSLAWSETRTQAHTDIVRPMPVALARRTCRRERRVLPRGGSLEWPLVVCAPATR